MTQQLGPTRLGRLIREVRGRLTIAEFAAAIDASRQSVSNWEFRDVPNGQNLKRILEHARDTGRPELAAEILVEMGVAAEFITVSGLAGIGQQRWWRWRDRIEAETGDALPLRFEGGSDGLTWEEAGRQVTDGIQQEQERGTLTEERASELQEELANEAAPA